MLKPITFNPLQSYWTKILQGCNKTSNMLIPEIMRVTRSYQHPTHNLLHLVTDASYGTEGAFLLPSLFGHHAKYFLCIASSEEGWEHVSVSIPGVKRTPTWEEMCHVKKVFWMDAEAVMQLHPPRRDWVSEHPYCLHLWRPKGEPIPLPPAIMVGRATLNKDENSTT